MEQYSHCKLDLSSPKHNQKAKSIQGIWPEMGLRFFVCLFCFLKRVGIIILEQHRNDSISQMTPKVWPPLGLRWNGLLQPIWSPGWLSRIRHSLLETTRYVGISSLKAHRSVIEALLNGPPTCNCGVKNKAACYSHKLQFCFRSREPKIENTLCLNLSIRAFLGYATSHDCSSLHSQILSRWAA